jgi:hypothetical protein
MHTRHRPWQNTNHQLHVPARSRQQDHCSGLSSKPGGAKGHGCTQGHTRHATRGMRVRIMGKAPRASVDVGDKRGPVAGLSTGNVSETSRRRGEGARRIQWACRVQIGGNKAQHPSPRSARDGTPPSTRCRSSGRAEALAAVRSNRTGLMRVSANARGRVRAWCFSCARAQGLGRRAGHTAPATQQHRPRARLAASASQWLCSRKA